MASKRYGIVPPTAAWAKHMRKKGKRQFWKKHRTADTAEAKLPDEPVRGEPVAQGALTT